MTNKIRKILIGICSAVILVSLIILCKILILDPMLADRTNKQAKDIYHSSEQETLAPEDKFKSLQELNSDIFGWIKINNTVIDYPVVWAQDGKAEFYLNHNYKKEKSKYGSIFMDPACDPTYIHRNTILYGHHMADGQMFAELLKYSDLEFYKSHPVIKFDTILSENTWKIISVFKTNTREEHGEIFNYTVADFDSTADFLEFVDEVKKRSLINIPVTVNEDDVLLTLSTCSYEYKDFRTVIVARKVRDQEDPEVETDEATKASNPLMPACYYR
ncbi:MAG: class B sortase [Clostridia bacterium]|nr:class B sortase [Clostridia bacterium]